jgi:predicted membrane-bound mannosyltransferase
MPVAARLRFAGLALLVFVLALAVRLPGLASRPVHPDEAVNAFILEETIAAGFHTYRAHDHHGPSLHYAAAALLVPAGLRRAADFELWHLRLLPALCGSALAASALLFRRQLGLAASLAAAATLGLAAPFVYYSGTFIHELLLILLFAAWLAVFWRWRSRPSAASAVLAGALAGLMLATKETAVLLLVPFALAGLPGSPANWPRRLSGLTLQAAAAAVLVAFVFGGFGRNLSGALDLFRAVGAQTGRGLGDEHAYPLFTYFGWLFAPSPVGVPWSAWLLAAFAAAGPWRGRRAAFARWLATGAALLVVIFSCLPYKTPWLALAWLLPLALLAGRGAATLARSPRARPALQVAVATVALGLLGAESYARCIRAPVTPGNPFAYSPGSPDLDRLDRALAAVPADELIQVVATDYWPLPWTLRRHTRVGFWQNPPDTLRPGLLLAGPEQLPALAHAAPFESYELRPGVFIFLGRLP